MAEQIDPIGADLRLSELLKDDLLAQESSAASFPAQAAAPTGVTFRGNIFEDFLSKAVAALNGVSQTELYANQLTDKYLKGEAELHEVMVAQAKVSVQVQLAVTTINTAVTTFKEITQMQV